LKKWPLDQSSNNLLQIQDPLTLPLVVAYCLFKQAVEKYEELKP